MEREVRLEGLGKIESYNYADQGYRGILSPKGTIMFQGLGFPKSVGDYICIPISTIQTWLIWGRTGKNIRQLDEQWYKSAEPLTTEDLQGKTEPYVVVNGHFCKRPPSPRRIIQIFSVNVGIYEIHKIRVTDKTITFHRLGQSVSLDLQNIPSSQRFTLTIEWEESYIEVRASWLEGESLKEFFSGNGVRLGNDTDLPDIPDNVEKNLIQYSSRKEFEHPLVPTIYAIPINTDGLNEDEYLFIRILEDIEKRVGLTESYEILQISGLLRQLFVDGEPLVHKVNRTYRKNIRFEIVDHHLSSLIREASFYTVQDGLDPMTAMDRNPLIQVGFDAFLSTTLIIVDQVEYSVRSVIKYQANVMGGIHTLPPDKRESALQAADALMRIGGLRPSLRQLKSIARVALRGLHPLREAIIKERDVRLKS
jgi:hypothetical protein